MHWREADDGARVEPCGLLEWARSFEARHCWHLVDVVRPRVSVSTIFLGLDHNFTGIGPPVLYETMVFGGRDHGRQWRYQTRATAMMGHGVAVALVSARRRLTSRGQRIHTRREKAKARAKR